jgi:hypothetical protein
MKKGDAMRTSRLLFVLAVVLAGVACSDTLSAPVTTWNSTLTVASETPAPGTAGSTLGGTATVTIAGGVITYSITLTGAPAGGGTVTAAHIHAGTSTGAATPTGTGAGIVRVNLCGTAAVVGPPAQAATPACPTGSAGNISNATVTYTSGSSAVLGAPAMTLDQLVTAIKAYGAYVNIHTSTNTGGEARGQLLPPPLP